MSALAAATARCPVCARISPEPQPVAPHSAGHLKSTNFLHRSSKAQPTGAARLAALMPSTSGHSVAPSISVRARARVPLRVYSDVIPDSVLNSSRSGIRSRLFFRERGRGRSGSFGFLQWQAFSSKREQASYKSAQQKVRLFINSSKKRAGSVRCEQPTTKSEHPGQ